ncbi:unnamed protein product [Lupinus luteus]|uniref:Probable purine permease n=1 Tax=Lupinus luteus TaxID=3873 RepID=A0AAV1VUK9_LUPLU
MEDNSFHNEVDQSRIDSRKRYYHWLLISLYAVFVLVSNSASTLLGRLYYEKGGKSKWMGSLVQHVGFPILLPCYCIIAPKKPTKNSFHSKQPSFSAVAFIYISYGICEAIICYFFSLGLWYLPVSTYALICSSQLAFNAFFSFFLNSMKFTPYVINSLFLLTISSALLVFQTETEHSSEVSKKNHVIGLICTVAASAGEGLVLSLVQLAFEKVLKRESSKVMLDMIVYESLVATCVTLVGLFASGEWNLLQEEMEGYEMGKTSYLLNLTFTAINWKIFGLGCVGLIFEVSSLFSNAISVLSLPFVPILAVFIFHEKMNGIIAISIVLAIWGFISYIYQHYMDGSNFNTENRDIDHVP